MRKLALLILTIIVTACSQYYEDVDNTIPAYDNKIINSKDNAVSGSLLVKLKAYTTEYQVEATDVEIASSPLFPTNNASEEELHSEAIYRWWILTFDENSDVEALAGIIAKDSRVEYVEYNSQMECIGSDSEVANIDVVTTRSSGKKELPFNDPLLAEQWHYCNDGYTYNGDDASLDTNHIEGADINLFSAWKYSTGDPRIVVAVLDGGVQYNHEDLAANMWVNEKEFTGTQGEDDDNNGFVDDIYGYNFCDNNAEITFDDHGTHVAGTIAAVNGNGIGVAGVAGGSGNGDGCRIMTCQIYDEDGNSAKTENIARAIKYAADNGAVIMNNSWAYSKGSYVSDEKFAKNYSVLIDAINYFEREASYNGLITGGIAIFAAGNDGYGTPSYPGAYYNNICVTSFAPNFTGSSFSNYGAGANICAPGGEIGAWYDKICSTSTNNRYEYMYGTSMAAPHVAGCAALALSYALELGKSFTREEFKSILLTSVHDIDQYQTERQGAFNHVTGEYETVNIEYLKGKLGAGYIDAHLLLMQIEGTPFIFCSSSKEDLISLDAYFGDGSEKLTYTSVEISDTDMNELGITTKPSFENGKLKIHCTKRGAARIKVTAIIGGNSVGGGDNMGGMEVTREFELVVRHSAAGNGGWL
ncbi:MAG: S8 family serine peptidase [Alistipes sp.]|nr:S8 family serine peptidase [Alistipes sp.]